MTQATMATNEFPMPANLRPAQAPSQPTPPAPTASPTVSPTSVANAFRAFAGQEIFVLDPDLKMALEDMCQAANGARWREAWPGWLSQMTNEGLRNLLGR